MGFPILATCLICGEPTTTPHEHHIIPQAYDPNKNGKTVTLCADHHNLIHALADEYSSKGTLDSSLWGSEYERVRGESLVAEILKAKAKGSQTFKIVYEVDQHQRARLTKLKVALGLSSIPKTIDFCVNAVMKEVGI